MNTVIELDTNWTLEQRRSTLINLLKNNVCNITFSKVDGSFRIMPCTLHSDYVPVQAESTANSLRARNDKTISVWCVDKDAWRSFRIENVTRIETIARATVGE